MNAITPGTLAGSGVRAAVLSSEQLASLGRVHRFLDGDGGRVGRLDGPAGSGKTTLLGHVIADRDDCAVLDGNRFGEAGYIDEVEALDTRDRLLLLAPTNRAARQLRHRTGFPASTIHKAIFVTVERLMPKGEQLRETLKVLSAQISQIIDTRQRTGLTLAANDVRRQLRREIRYERLARDLAGLVSAVVIDEASMVNVELLRALCGVVGAETPVLLCGDGHQLQPVEGEAVFHRVPALVTLSAVRRHGGRILELCEHLRAGGGWHDWQRQPDDRDAGLYVGPKPDRIPVQRLLEAADVLLTGTHYARRRLNALLRDRLLGVGTLSGEPGACAPRIGERLIVKSNDRDSNLFNGDFVSVAAIVRNPQGKLIASLQPLGENNEADGAVVAGVELDELAGFGDYTGDLAAKPTVARRQGPLTVDYGYCVTVHAGQGGQWGRVLVWDHPVGDPTRWRYTAASRAKQSLIVLH
jgi:ATP-dependent exoDNAse (exonuclease V) alpha subunit